MVERGADHDKLLVEALGAGAIVAALRRIHVGCRKLISFDDFFQEVISRSLARRSSFTGVSEGELINWIKAIGQNFMIDLLRRSRRRRMMPLPFQIADHSAVSPHDAVSRDDDFSNLRSMIGELDEMDGKIFNLHYVDKLSFKDISILLKVKHNTLIKRHVRLLGKLREIRLRRTKVE